MKENCTKQNVCYDDESCFYIAYIFDFIYNLDYIYMEPSIPTLVPITTNNIDQLTTPHDMLIIIQ